MVQRQSLGHQGRPARSSFATPQTNQPERRSPGSQTTPGTNRSGPPTPIAALDNVGRDTPTPCASSPGGGSESPGRAGTPKSRMTRHDTEQNRNSLSGLDQENSNATSPEKCTASSQARQQSSPALNYAPPAPQRTSASTRRPRRSTSVPQPCRTSNEEPTTTPNSPTATTPGYPPNIAA
jgi:hypothetical protein